MRIFYFIDAPGEVNLETSRFYQVQISSSKQGDRDFLYLIAYAAENSAFFEVRSLESTAFINRIANSLAVDFLPFVSIKARALVSALKKGVAVPLDASAIASKNHLRFINSLDYRIAAKIASMRA